MAILREMYAHSAYDVSKCIGAWLPVFLHLGVSGGDLVLVKLVLYHCLL